MQFEDSPYFPHGLCGALTAAADSARIFATPAASAIA